MDRKELVALCYKAKHMLTIRDRKYILRGTVIYSKLTYDTEEQVIDFCNNISSWERR